ASRATTNRIPRRSGGVPPGYVIGRKASCRSEVSTRIHVIAANRHGVGDIIHATTKCETIPGAEGLIKSGYIVGIDPFRCREETAYINVISADEYGVDRIVDAVINTIEKRFPSATASRA